MCLYPRIMKNKRYTVTKKNGGHVPAILDNRVLYVPVGCGKCMECRKQKAREWQVRLMEDIKTNTNGKFVTLTFSNESIKELSKEIKGIKGYELDNQIATLAVRRWLERYRKKNKTSIRHWLITELGSKNTEHIHMHGIIYTNDTLEEIEKYWKYGHIWKGYELKKTYVNEKTINYLIKYVHKVDKKHEYYKSKILCSAGIGRAYTDRAQSENNKYRPLETKESYKTTSGHEIAMPIYWRNKIYSEQERELLWIEKIDKQERWVCGEKIDISKSEEEYYKILEYYRQKNKRLGYGDDQVNWDKKKYENERRQIKIIERITKSKTTEWEEKMLQKVKEAK